MRESMILANLWLSTISDIPIAETHGPIIMAMFGNACFFCNMFGLRGTSNSLSSQKEAGHLLL